MVKSAKNSHMEEEEEEDEYEDDVVNRTTPLSSSNLHKEMGVNEQKGNTPRSKHSETEQRRRCKINERFQTLRDLIPQNDQKRDKASFLLEVIEYIQFLQEKIQVYEGPYQGWSQETSKLIPWRSNPGTVENFVEHSQMLRNGHDNNLGTSSMLTNSQNSEESDFSMAASFKAMEHPPGKATTPSISLQGAIISSEGRCIMPTLSPQGFISNLDHNAYQNQFRPWRSRPSTSEVAVPSTAKDELNNDSRTSSISNAYSQGVLHTLSQALQSSGVDLAQTSISVQIDVGKRTDSGLAATASFSKVHGNTSPTDQAMMQADLGSFYDNSEQSLKRLRTENS